MTVVVTGSAGFIGSHVALRLLERGERVIGFDNLNDYYDVSLKRARLARLMQCSGYTHVTADLADRAAVESFFSTHRPTRVVHLAAQAGVRYAADNPHVYVASNLIGFLHVLEGCRQHAVEHLVYASTSSVYGANRSLPFSEHQSADHPLTLYAATKKANEMMAHAYAHLYRLPCTGLRFFTVYGPWGRPDMAFFKFTRAILEGRPIPLFNHGNHSRDFTYIDDIVDGVIAALEHPAAPNPVWDGTAPDPATSLAPHRLYNLGGSRPIGLRRAITLLEDAIGRKAEFESLPLQAGDVLDTAADTSDLVRDLGWKPKVPIEEGIPRFVRWYREYHGV